MFKKCRTLFSIRLFYNVTLQVLVILELHEVKEMLIITFQILHILKSFTDIAEIYSIIFWTSTFFCDVFDHL